MYCPRGKFKEFINEISNSLTGLRSGSWYLGVVKNNHYRIGYLRLPDAPAGACDNLCEIYPANKFTSIAPQRQRTN